MHDGEAPGRGDSAPGSAPLPLSKPLSGPPPAPPSKPLLLFDGDCGFCRAWIERWRAAVGDAVDFAPYQEAAHSFPEVPRERFAEAVQLVEPGGRWSSGAEAAFRALAYGPGGGAWHWLYRHVPGFAALSEWIYRRVAANRRPLSTLTRWIWGSHLAPPGERRTTHLFLRVLGFVYVCAFVSLWTQVEGLVGREGIYPVGQFLEIVRRSVGPAGYWWYPTLCWIAPGDPTLHLLCALGTLAGLGLMLGLAANWCLALAWVCYLSLATVCQDFLWFQWDSLLLEGGLLALFLFPGRWGLRASAEAVPTRGGRFILRWLLFRLMVSSAIVKWTSGDPSWRSLTALEYHYETQPLPIWTAWYAHHLPAAFQQASAVVMFVVEGFVPFLLWAPRRIRFAAAGAIATLQLAIAATGNYGIFNLLTIALCLLALDDGVLPAPLRGAPRAAAALDRPRRAGLGKVLAITALFLVSLVPLVGTLRSTPRLLEPLARVYRYLSPLRVVNGYGLFAVMTTRRPEIVIEGSRDGVEWRPYGLRWKPGDPRRRPGFVAPHMPRLDWQMWFAALSDVSREPWFVRFCGRILQGSKPILGLMDKNPFPDAPPRYLRALVYEYRFSDAATRRATGAWWTRELQGYYAPILTLREGDLMAVPPDSLPQLDRSR